MAENLLTYMFVGFFVVVTGLIVRLLIKLIGKKGDDSYEEDWEDNEE